MKFKFSPKAETAYRDLPPAIRKATKKQVEFLLKDIRHPSLKAKRRGGERRLWQGRITRDYRFYFEIVGDTYWIEAIIKHPK